jgi:hypothetical protein
MGCGANKANTQGIANITLTQPMNADSEAMFIPKSETELKNAQKTVLNSGSLTVLEDWDVHMEQPARSKRKREETFEIKDSKDQSNIVNPAQIQPEPIKSLNSVTQMSPNLFEYKRPSVFSDDLASTTQIKLPPLYPNKPKLPDIDDIYNSPGSFDFDFLLDESSNREERNKRGVLVDELLEDLENI